MMVVALSCIPHDLEISCFGTLSKYIKEGHEVCLIIAKSKETWSKETINAIMKSSRIIGVSKIYFVSELNSSLVTQDNVKKLRSHIETLDPTIVIFPSIRTGDGIRKIFAKSCLLACRGIGNIMMYDSQKNANFRPTIFSIINGELEVKKSCLDTYGKKVGTNKTSKKNMMLLLKRYRIEAGIKNFVEAFETNRILLLSNAGF